MAGTKTVAEQQCEAYYYAGMANLLKGDKVRAKEFFGMSVATKVSPYPEYSLSRSELIHMATPTQNKRLEQLKKQARVRGLPIARA
ncbi:MAG: hypothetical protein ABIZ04_24945 [Opitutus sp.]